MTYEDMKMARKALGLTQKEMGESLGVGQSYMSEVENGKERPSKMFVKLFEVLYLKPQRREEDERNASI